MRVSFTPWLNLDMINELILMIIKLINMTKRVIMMKEKPASVWINKVNYMIMMNAGDNYAAK